METMALVAPTMRSSAPSRWPSLLLFPAAAGALVLSAVPGVERNLSGIGVSLTGANMEAFGQLPLGFEPKADQGDQPSADGFLTKMAASTVASDLTVIESASPSSALQGSSITYTVTSQGPEAATGVSVTDTLPAGVAFVSSSATQGSCSGTTTVSCSLGILNNGSSATVTIVATAQTTGTLSNTATVVSVTGDPTLSNDTATSLTTANPPIPVPGVTTWDLVALAALLTLAGLYRLRPCRSMRAG